MLDDNLLTNIANSQQNVDSLVDAINKLQSERDQYRELYLKTLELCKKLELGILGQKRERFINDAQLTLPLIKMLTEGETLETPNTA